MNDESTEIRINGKDTKVPSTRIGDRTILVTASWLRTATVQDEAHVVGEIVSDPEGFVAQLKKWDARPDIFTFSQKITDPTPKFQYHMEWFDFAVIPISTYEDWFRNRIKKDVKENLRRAKREGVIVQTAQYDDRFVQGIKDLCDETPIRQGKRFWHHGKSFEEIKKLHGTYSERAEYIGAYFGDELIGFIKMVYTDSVAKTMHVISKERHHQKRPTNALIAKAVEVCAEKGLSHLIYGEYNFPGKKKNSLTEFKRHNGFEEMRYPRYFVPLSSKGKLAIKLSLHREAKTWIPLPVANVLLRMRAHLYRNFYPLPTRAAQKLPIS